MRLGPVTSHWFFCRHQFFFPNATGTDINASAGSSVGDASDGDAHFECIFSLVVVVPLTMVSRPNSLAVFLFLIRFCEMRSCVTGDCGFRANMYKRGPGQPPNRPSLYTPCVPIFKSSPHPVRSLWPAHTAGACSNRRTGEHLFGRIFRSSKPGTPHALFHV